MTTAIDEGQIPSFEMRHRLQLAREHAGYSRAQLADRMEVSRNSVLNAETGRSVPRKIVLNAWAMACGVPVDWIITGKPPTNDPGPTSGLGIICAEDAPKPSKQARIIALKTGSKSGQDAA